MKYLSLFALPVFIGAILIFGIVKKVNVYDSFIEGAKSGLESTVGILPALVGLMVAISMLRQSGVIEIVANALSPVLKKTGLTSEVLPLAILRPVSGSASIAIVTDIFKNFGPDSISGKLASVMMGSTETTFYTVAVYFGAVGIKKTRHTLIAALSADITGILLSAVLVKYLM